MAQNARLALTVPPDLDATITALAKIQGVPKTQIVLAFLSEIHEPMKLLLTALQQVSEAQKTPLQVLAPIFENITRQYSDVAVDFSMLAKS